MLPSCCKQFSCSLCCHGPPIAPSLPHSTLICSLVYIFTCLARLIHLGRYPLLLFQLCVSPQPNPCLKEEFSLPFGCDQNYSCCLPSPCPPTCVSVHVPAYLRALPIPPHLLKVLSCTSSVSRLKIFDSAMVTVLDPVCSVFSVPDSQPEVKYRFQLSRQIFLP
jgi:hypothetical protein